jgi:hypothetical protein
MMNALFRRKVGQEEDLRQSGRYPVIDWTCIFSSTTQLHYGAFLLETNGSGCSESVDAVCGFLCI